MTSSRNFDRLLQVTCLGLVGMLTAAGCGGSSNNPPDAKIQTDTPVGVVPPPDALLPVGGLSVDQATVNFGSVDQGSSATKTVVVTNTGVPVAVSPQVAGEGFLLQSTTCTTVATKGTCTITVGFFPAADKTGGASGVLTVATGITVSLSGVVTAKGTFTATMAPLAATALLNQALPVTVTVVATAALTDLSCLNSGPDLTADPANTTCTATLAASAPCTYAFTFKGVKAGAASDSITCSGAGKIQVLPVSLTVLSPAVLSVTPNPGSFSTVAGTPSDPITFRVRNSGSAASGAVTVAITGTGAAQFAMADNQCGGPLDGGASCTVQVVFKPTAAATVTAALTATDATAGSTPASAVLNGTAIAPSLLTITGAADLGQVTVNQTGAASTYTIINGGGTASGILKIAAADAQFAIGNDLCSGLALAASKNCTFTAAFTPASAGVKTTLLTASSGDAALVQKQVQGTGIAIVPGANLSMNPPTLDFGTIGVGTTAGPKTFTVSNSGGVATGPLSVVKYDSTSSVGGASQFSYTTTCSAALAPLGTCVVAVTFAPTISRSASATISVSDGTVSAPPRTVVGIALDRPALTLSCGPADTTIHSWRTGAVETFTDTVIGKTSAPLVCTLTNTGSSTQDTGAITVAVTGEFAVPAASNNCTASLAPGLGCTFAMTFSPTVMGQRDGTLTVTTTNRGAINQAIGGVGLGVIEIVEFEPCSPDHVAGCSSDANDPNAPNAVVTEPFDFGQVTAGTTSTTALTLAVYVRASVGNLSVTKDFGTPDNFLLATGSGLGTDCDFFATNPTPTSGFLLETPLCFKTVVFTPKGRTKQNGTVTVSGANSQTDSATMTGTGSGPLTISPSPLTFSNVAVNTSSTTLTLTVRNSGADALDGMAYVKAGTNADQFSVVLDNLTGQSISGGGGLRILGVRYIPTATGAAAATITVSGTVHNNSAVETQVVNLIGNGATGPVMTATIASNGVFPSTFAGARSAALTVTVSNAAGSQPTGPVTFSISPVSDFTTTPIDTSVLQGSCSLAVNNPVAGGSSCTYLVWFTPNVGSALVARTATLKVSAGPGMGGDVLLPLSGTADSQIAISPAGPAATPVDMGTTVVNSSTISSVTFTVTNNSLTNIPANGLTITTGLSTNGPNKTALFAVDTSASNTCNGIVAKSGGTCVFKLNAIATDLTQLGTFFGQVKVTVVANPAQVAKADVKTTVVKPAMLSFTPSTDFLNLTNDPNNPAVARNLGTIVLGTTSAAAKYTLVNTGGRNSSAITALLRAHGLNTDQTKARFAVDATACTGLGEAGLAPGAKCDILVTFHPTPDGVSDASGTFDADLVVTATNGIPTEIRRWVTATASALQTDSYIVDDTTGLAPADLGVLPGTAAATVTKVIAVHAGTSSFTLPATLPTAPTAALGVTGSTTEAMTITAGPAGNSPCVAGATLAASAKCTLSVTWTLGSSAALSTPGWRAFTVSVGSLTMNLSGRVGAQASLLASRTALDFGQVLASGAVESQHETVVITNVGELTTTGNVIAAVTTDVGISTSGCGSTLAYLGTCTLTIWVVPQTPGASPTATVTATATGAVSSAAIGLTWFGTTVASLSLTSTDGTAHTFADQAVLSTTADVFQFTIKNGLNAQKSGVLAFAVTDSTGKVATDFSVVPNTTSAPTASTCLTMGVLNTNESCTLTMQFTPISLTPESKVETLTVTATPGTTTTPPAATLTGKAVPALSVTGPGGIVTATDGSKSLALAATSVAGAGTAVTVTFKNEILAPATGILTTAVSGANSTDFLVTTDGCTGRSLASNGTCDVVMLFKPTAVGTGKTAVITVSGSPGDSAALTLTGNAITH